MRAAAQLDRIGARLVATVDRPHRDDAHLVAVFFAEQRLAPDLHRSSTAISRVVTGSFCSTMRLAMSSTSASSAALTGLGWAMSKRSRSGATSEPFCAT